MRTAKSILGQYRDDSKYPNINLVVFAMEDCLLAMEEYANQFKQSQPNGDEVGLREKLGEIELGEDADGRSVCLKEDKFILEEIIKVVNNWAASRVDALREELTGTKKLYSECQELLKEQLRARVDVTTERNELKKRVEELERKESKITDSNGDEVSL